MLGTLLRLMTHARATSTTVVTHSRDTTETVMTNARAITTTVMTHDRDTTKTVMTHARATTTIDISCWGDYHDCDST